MHVDIADAQVDPLTSTHVSEYHFQMFVIEIIAELKNKCFFCLFVLLCFFCFFVRKIWSTILVVMECSHDCGIISIIISLFNQSYDLLLALNVILIVFVILIWIFIHI